MPKNIIKIGYIVETRDKKLFMALPSDKHKDEIILVSEDGFNLLDYYADDLTVDIEKVFPEYYKDMFDLECLTSITGCDDFDIIRIYGLCSDPTRALKLSIDSRPLVWDACSKPQAKPKVVAQKINITKTHPTSFDRI